MRQGELKPRILSLRPIHEKDGQFAPTSTVELPDAQLPRELDGRGRVE